MPNVIAASGNHRNQVHSEVRRPLETVLAQVVWYVFGVIDVLIAIRFVLKLLGANSGSGFVQLIHGMSGFFMAPFAAIFGVQHVSGATFEWSALVAIAVYALVAWGIVVLIRVVSPREHPETVERDEQNEDVRVP